MITKYEFHPLADVLPIQPAAVKRMKPHMAVHGQQEAILLFEGKILKGRHRYLACQELKLEPLVKEFRGTWDDAVASVTGELLGKRLSVSERAMAASKLAQMKRGNPKSACRQISTQSVAQASETFNVSPRSVARARELQAGGVPELVEAAAAEKVSLADAADAAKESPAAQRAALAAVASGEAKTLAAALAQPSANGKPKTRKQAEVDMPCPHCGGSGRVPVPKRRPKKAKRPATKGGRR